MRSRWKSYKYQSRKIDKNEKYLQRSVCSHFESESITLIDKAYGSDPMKREICWIHTLKTLATYRLNVENSTLHSTAMPGGESFFS